MNSPIRLKEAKRFEVSSLLSRFRKGGIWDSLVSSALLTPAGTLFQFALTVVVARSLAVPEFGLFVYSLQVASIVAVIIGAGLPTFAQKIVPALRATGEKGELDAFITGSLAWTTMCGLLLLLIVVSIPTLRNTPQFYGVALSIIPVSLWLMQLYMCLGFNKIPLGLIPRDFITPTIVIVAIQFYSPRGAIDLLIFYNIVLVASVFFGLVALFRSEKVNVNVKLLQPLLVISWFRRAFPMAISSLAQLGLNTLDLVVLGIIGSMQDVGAYAACLRIALAVSILNKVLTIAVGHKLSALIATSQYLAVLKVYKQSMIMSAGSGLVLLVIVILFGEELLTLFGQEYTPYYNILLVLSVGNFASSLVGPIIAGHNMIENQAYIAKSQLIWMSIALALYFLIIPTYSLMGAALVTVTTQTLMKLFQLRSFFIYLAGKTSSL